MKKIEVLRNILLKYCYSVESLVINSTHNIIFNGYLTKECSFWVAEYKKTIHINFHYNSMLLLHEEFKKDESLDECFILYMITCIKNNISDRENIRSKHCPIEFTREFKLNQISNE